MRDPPSSFYVVLKRVLKVPSSASNHVNSGGRRGQFWTCPDRFGQSKYPVALAGVLESILFLRKGFTGLSHMICETLIDYAMSKRTNTKYDALSLDLPGLKYHDVISTSYDIKRNLVAQMECHRRYWLILCCFNQIIVNVGSSKGRARGHSAAPGIRGNGEVRNEVGREVGGEMGEEVCDKMHGMIHGKAHGKLSDKMQGAHSGERARSVRQHKLEHILRGREAIRATTMDPQVGEIEYDEGQESFILDRGIWRELSGVTSGTVERMSILSGHSLSISSPIFLCSSGALL